MLHLAGDDSDRGVAAYQFRAHLLVTADPDLRRLQRLSLARDKPKAHDLLGVSSRLI